MDDRTEDRTPDIGGGTDGPTWLTATEAASSLGVNERTVRRAIASGAMRAVKDRGVYRIAPAELDRIRRASVGIAPGDRAKDAQATFAIPSFPVRRSTPVGRDEDIATLRTLLTGDGPRLVTLTGTGGVGKTRLALAVGDSLRHAFRDGLWFVPLATIRDGSLMIPTIASVLGVRVPNGPDAVSRLVDVLRDRSLMLVLDNVEQLAASAALLVPVLEGCPEVRILATSRVPLHVTGEQRYGVAPLSVPRVSVIASPADALAYAAVRLFVERARQAVVDFTLDEGSAVAVSRLCARLDGLPLAIELAAARMDMLTPQALLDRLALSLDLLSDGPQDQPERLRTMRDSISWSYELLSPESQLLFRRLSVFVGGFTLAAAEALTSLLSPRARMPTADDTLRDLTRLVDGNLVRRAVGGDGTDRFGMLQTLREFGLELLEKLDEAADAHQAQAELWAEFARANHPHHREPTVPIDEVLDRLEVEMPNVRAALWWAREQGDGLLALRLSSWLAVFWFLRDHMSEGADWLEWSISHTPDALDADRARALHGLGNLMWPVGRFDEADRLGTSALAMASTLSHAELVAESTHLLGLVATNTGRWQEGRALMERVRGMWDALGVQPNVGMTWLVLAGADEGLGDPRKALADAEQAMTTFREHGPAEGLSAALRRIGQLYQTLGDEGAAVAVYREIVERWRAKAGMEDRRSRHAILDELGPPARSRWLRADDPRSLVRSFAGLARIMSAHGQEEHAASLLGVLDRLIGADDVSVNGFDRANADAAALAARLALGPERFDRSRAEGRAMTLDAALGVALRQEPLAQSTPEAADDTFGLTRREREVLCLVAEGMSDRAIAERLVVSRYTASNHVSNILGKLDAPSRAAAAGIAIRHGLA